MEVGERYKVLELIGEGSFGRVYKGRRKFSKQVMYAPLWKRSPSCYNFWHDFIPSANFNC